MTRSNTINKNKKIFILEGSGADYKDKTMCYEKFKVIVGDNKEELNFYYTFFANNSLIKKGEIYELSITGNFVQDSSEIIQGIDNGGYEFVKITPSLLIKELWDEKEKGIEKLDLMEEDLENKIEYVERINQELLDMRNDFSDLTVRFDNLQVENEKNVKRLNDYKESLRKKEEENKKINQSWASSKEEVTRLKGQLNSLRSENTKIENGRVTLKRQADLFREQEVLQNQLKTERRKNQMLIEQLEEVQNQELSETIQKKLQGKKDWLERLKIMANSKLGENQENSLESLLFAQEQFDSLIFDNINQTHRIFSLTKDKLQQAKDKLIKKQLSSEEIESLCEIQTEISKLETQQKQWEKMEILQDKEEQFEEFTSIPPKQ